MKCLREAAPADADPDTIDTVADMIGRAVEADKMTEVVGATAEALLFHNIGH